MDSKKDIQDLARRGGEILAISIAFMFTWMVASVVATLVLRVTLAPALVSALDLFGLGTPNAGRIVSLVILISVMLGFAAAYKAVKSVLASNLLSARSEEAKK